MINFVLDPTPALGPAQYALMALLREHLPERSCIASLRRYRPKRLNVAFGVRENADVLLPLGDSKEWLARVDDESLPYLKRFRHVLLAEEPLRRRLLADKRLGFTEQRLHLVSGPQGGISASLAAAALQELAQARQAAGFTRAERIPVF